MKIKSFFKESATLWYVGLLTVQFCAGLVFALDAERIHDTGKEIKIADRVNVAKFLERFSHIYYMRTD